MTWLTPDFTVDDAISRGLETWELLVNNWGNFLLPSADGTSLQFPAVGQRGLPSTTTIAIGPRSTVDRCWVEYDAQRAQVPSTLRHRLSVGAPLTFFQPANRGVVGSDLDESNGSSIRILAHDPDSPITNRESTMFRDEYERTDGNVVTFGSTAVGSTWLAPLLHLIYYLTPARLPPPTKRFPFAYRNRVTGVPSGTEFLAHQIPVFGRKTIVLVLRPSQVSDLRVGLIHNVSSEGIQGSPLQESTVFTAAASPADTAVRVPLQPAFGDYLMVYINPNAVPSSLLTTVYATDD